MQSAFEKIIEKIKEAHLGGRTDAQIKAIEIVNQVASEYDDFEIFTKEQLASIEQMNIDTFNRMVALKRNGGGWIPCSERLPEDGKSVLVWFEYFRYGRYNRLYQTYGFSEMINGRWSGLINGETGWRDLKIIAWQPLPEPYKVESEE